MREDNEPLPYGCGFEVAKRSGRNIAYPAAPHASNMVVAAGCPIILLLSAAEVKLPDEPGPAENIEIPIHRPKTDIRQLPPDALVDRIRAEVPAGRTELVQDCPALASHADRKCRLIAGVDIRNGNYSCL